jgi:hypothetical protein
MMKPNASAIAAAINNAEHGGWIDPSIVPLTWHCEFGRHGKNGKRPFPKIREMVDGVALLPGGNQATGVDAV